MNSWKTWLNFKIELCNRFRNEIQVLQPPSWYNSHRMVFLIKTGFLSEKKKQVTSEARHLKREDERRNHKCYTSLKVILFTFSLKTLKASKYLEDTYYYIWILDSPAMDLNNPCYVKQTNKKIILKHNKAKKKPKTNNNNKKNPTKPKSSPSLCWNLLFWTLYGLGYF